MTEALRPTRMSYLALGLLVVGLLATAPAMGDDEIAFGEYLASECVTCHQISGTSVGAIPPIVGWPREQFVAVFDSYRKKERDNAVMQTLAARLSDEEIKALAAYFGSLEEAP